MSQCAFTTSVADEHRSCPRDAVESREYCPFHLDPAERREVGLFQSDLRQQFLTEVRSGDEARKQLVGATFEEFDLSSVVIDSDDLDGIVFRDVTVDGVVDLSGAIVRNPMTLDTCDVGQLSVTDATFEFGLRVEDSTLGNRDDRGTSLTAKRATFEEGLDITGVDVCGNVEFASGTVEGWLDVEDVTVDRRVHFPRATLETVQFIDVSFAAPIEFVDATVETLIFERTRFETSLDLSGADIETIRSRIVGETTVDLREATVASGRLDQPADGTVLYDLTEATVGDVAIDCSGNTFDRYRFYRTRFDDFSFAAYRDVLRANDWQLHEFAGDADDDVEDLEITYLEAKQGATAVGDNENAAAFFVREMQYRRGRYAAHFRNQDYTVAHRSAAGLRWLTNGLLGLLAGYGERPQRTLGAALLVILGSALAYPAVGGLDVGGELVTYASHGAEAVLDSIYFSVVTFTTLGLGDVEPVGGLGRTLVGTEALAGAFLTALFVFTLGRRVTR